jgi:hypothetical protein
MSVMALAPKMLTAEQAENQLQAAEFALGEICAKFRSLITHLDQQIHQQMREKGQLEVLAEEENNQYQVKHTAITGDQLLALRTTEFADDKAQELKSRTSSHLMFECEMLNICETIYCRPKNGEKHYWERSQKLQHVLSD